MGHKREWTNSLPFFSWIKGPHSHSFMCPLERWCHMDEKAAIQGSGQHVNLSLYWLSPLFHSLYFISYIYPEGALSYNVVLYKSALGFVFWKSQGKIADNRNTLMKKTIKLGFQGCMTHLFDSNKDFSTTDDRRLKIPDWRWQHDYQGLHLCCFGIKNR